ncbi:MAG: WYL domain-containing protein [Pirellulales bacterium]
MARQWKFLRILAHRRQGVPLKELAVEAGVTERTVRRDLEMFRTLGFPLTERTGEYGRKTWRLEVESLASLSFTLDEALAFYLGRRFLDPLAGTAPGDAAQRGFAKLRDCLGPAALRYVDRLAGSVLMRLPGASDYRAQSHLLDTLLHAMADRRAALITYRSSRATEPVEYEVHPYAIVTHKGAIYLLAFSRDHGEVRTFKMNRMETAEATMFPFERPQGFEAHAYLRGAFGIYSGQGDERIRLRFSAIVARYVQEGRWHESQQLAPQPDGSLLADFRLSSVDEILRWIQSFGPHCTVLSPPHLQARHRAEAQALVDAYAASTNRSSSTSAAATAGAVAAGTAEAQDPSTGKSVVSSAAGETPAVPPVRRKTSRAR